MKRHASMNRIYRLVWSQVAHTWIAVAENAKGHGKSVSGHKLMAATLALLSPMALSSLAGAAPSGGQIASGTGSIAQSGAVTTINQTSQNLSLNWQGFNVGAQETVNFVQPSASAIAVNRIFDTNGSQILGNLNANGQVYLINPNGVLFGAGAQVNVGGLVASTLGFDDADLGRAARSFAGAGTGSVVNQGNIRGGYVALLGNAVSNTGTITASGTAALGAGNAVTLTFAGNSLVKMQVDQSTLNNQAANGGLIRADGGTVLMSAGAKNALLASVVNNTGVIEARSVQNVNGTIVLDGGNIGEVSNSGTLDASGKNAGETGGTVKLLGGQIDVLAGANVDVSGDAGGGTALFGGNYQGKGPEQNATTANVATGASIDADALTSGNGGKIVVWSDGHTTVDGAFGARGGATGGDGGFVETSGKKLTVGANARINTLAPKGKAGDWLLDPTDFTIYAGGSGDILDSTLITNLGGGNVTILSSSGGSGTNGDIILNSDVWVQWGAPTTLTLSAYRHVNVNGWLDTIGAGGSGSIVLRADNTGTGTGTVNIATGISSGGTSLIATQGVGSTTIYTNAPSSTTGYKADGPADCASGSFCGTFNVYQLVRADTAGVVNNKTYNGNTTATMQTAFGLAGTPAGATLTAGTATFDTKNVGTGKTVTFSGYSAGGSVDLGSGITATYYLSNQPGSKTANITAANLTVTGVTAGNKTYDATTAATLGGTAAVTALGSDTVTVGGTGSGTFADKNVGNGKAVTVTGYTLGGADAGNYTIVQPTGVTANITAANLAVTGVTAGNKTYDGTTAATLGGTAAVTALGSDTVTVGGTGSGTFANKNVGNGKAVTISGYTLGGADAGNYTVVQPAGVTANITPAAITVSGITVENKTYDTTTAAPVNTAGAVFTGKVGGDTVTVSASGTFADKNVANGKTVTLASSYGGADAGNYAITDQATTTANITPANLTVTGVTASNKTYDATTAATLGGTAVVAALGSDTVTVGGTGSGTFADKNVGNGKAVTVTGYTLGGADAGNYTIVQPTGVTANITAANLAVTGVIANSKTYDGTTTATLSGTATVFALGSDTVTVGGTGSGTFANKNVGTGKTVTIAGYTLGGADAGNYTIVQPGGTANITAKAMTLSGIAAANKVYDGTTSATVNAAGAVFTGLVGGDTVTVSATGAFADKSVANGKTVTLTSSYGGADAGNYAITDQASATANITPKSMSVSGIVGNNKVYDGTTAATANTAGATLTGLVGGDTVTVSATGTFADKNVANGKTVTLASSYGGADAGNYTITDQANTTANITAKALTLGGITAGNKVYDGTTAATLNTAGVTFSGLVGADVVTLGGAGSGTFANKNVGNGKTVTVSGYTLGGADAGNYSVGQPTGLTANITAKAMTLSGIAAANKVYDGTTSATVNAAGAVFTGLVGGDTVTVSATGAFADKSVANGKTVTLTSSYGGADAGNYAITDQASATANITPKSMSVSGIVGNNKVYDGTTAATANTAGATLTGLVGGDTVTVSATGTFADKNVANGKTVTLASSYGGADAGNYAITDQATTTANITPANLTVTGVTASNKTYDATTAATLGGTAVVAALGSDTVTVGGTGSGTFADKNVGNGKAVTASGYTLGGADAGNYTIVQPGGLTANITAKAMTLSGIAAANKVYDGTTSATVNAAGAVFTGLVGGDTVTVSATGAFADKSVANGKTVTLTSSYGGADAGNYAITDQASATANITPKSMSVSGIVGNNKVYDGTTAATANTAGATLTGLVGGDTVTVSATGTFADKNVANGKTVTLASSYGGADAGNYTITDQANTTANITAKALTLGGITAGNKVYDGTTAATLNTAGVTFSGLVGADVVTLGGAGSGTFANKNVGNGKTVTVSGYTLGGADAGNYSVGQPTGLTANITAKAMTLSGIAAANKVYDGTTSATVNAAGAVFTGLVGGDTVTVSATGAFADKSVANGKTVTLTSSYGGADAGNYAITDQASATANITPKSMSVSGIAASNKIYDGTTAATVSAAGAVLTGLVGGDTVTVSATGAFADKNAGNGKTVTLASSYGGADLGNYTITDQANTTANITPKGLTVAANADTKFHDGVAYAGGNGVTYAGLVAGETEAVLGGALTYGGTSQGATAVGSYTITPGGLTSGNYALNFVDGALTINASAAPVEAQNAATQVISQVLAGSVVVSVSPTITVSRVAAPAKQDVSSGSPANSKGNTTRNNPAQNNTTENDSVENEQAESEHREVVNVAMNYSRGGPTLRIMNGGTRLPVRYGQQNE